MASGLMRIAAKSRALNNWKRVTEKLERITQGAYPGCTLMSGRYFLERLDPLHEYGERLHDRHKSWSLDTAGLSFFDWLDNGRTNPVSQVLHLPEQSLDNHRIFVKEGALILPRGFNPKWLQQITQTTAASTTLIFVVNQFGRIYAGIKESGSFHHSSFLRGKPVTMAGTLEVDRNLTVRGVSNCSGHYKTGRDATEQFVRRLHDCGVPLAYLTVDFGTSDQPRTQTHAVRFLRNCAVRKTPFILPHHPTR